MEYKNVNKKLSILIEDHMSIPGIMNSIIIITFFPFLFLL